MSQRLMKRIADDIKKPSAREGLVKQDKRMNILIIG
mgnify:FL=1